MATVNKDFVSRYGIQGTVLKSTVATGTAPLIVASTTLVTNLNAQYLNGNPSSAFVTNVMTTLGDTTYGGAAGAFTRLAGNTTTTPQFLTSTGSGGLATAPSWTGSTGSGNVVLATSPTLVTPTLGVATATSINAVGLAALATGFTVAGGTTSKTLTVSNTLTLAGTDTSTLNIGSGGTLGTAAFTAATAYQAASTELAGIVTAAASNGLLRRTGANTWTMDSSTYLTSSTGVTTVNGSSGAISNVALTTGKLSQFAATTSAELAGVLSDETGYSAGALNVFNISPSFSTSIVASTASFDLINTTATTVNFAKAATNLSIGAATGTTTINNNAVVSGNLTVNGTTTTINSTVIAIDDINMILGDIAVPTNNTADGGGITLKGATDKTINWINSTSSWTSSEDWDLANGKVYRINGTSILSATTLGTSVVNSSITKVGLASAGFVKSDASGNLSVDTATYLTAASTLDASKLSGTIPTAVLGNSTHYIGTTAIALNRASASMALTGITSIDGSAASAGKATNLTGGNSTTLLGAIHYQSNVDVSSILSPNTTTTKNFLSMTGTGTNGAAPVWSAVTKSDVGLANVENTALSTWAGSSSITTVGTLTNLTVTNTITGSVQSLAGTNSAQTDKTVTIVANATPTTVDSFLVATYTSAEYLIQMKQGTKMTTTKLLVVWDGADVQISEYGYVDATAGAANATLTASHAAGTMTVSASSSDGAATNVVIKASVTYIKA